MGQSSPKAEVVGSNPVGRANDLRSIPTTWVTVDTGHMGNTFDWVLSLIGSEAGSGA